MANVKIVGGKVWNIPVSGGMVSLNDADVGSILSAIGGAVKAASVLGAIGFGISALAAVKSSGARTHTTGPFFPLASVTTLSRQFIGVCLNEKIAIRTHDGYDLEIPIPQIWSYKATIGSGGFLGLQKKTMVEVSLVDHSTYSGELMTPNEFEFITPIGKQSVDKLQEHWFGYCTTEAISDLRKALYGVLGSEAAQPALNAEAVQRFLINKTD